MPALRHLSAYAVYLKAADEVLDYKKALWMYQGCHLVVDQGGQHDFDDVKNTYLRS